MGVAWGGMEAARAADVELVHRANIAWIDGLLETRDLTVRDLPAFIEEQWQDAAYRARMRAEYRLDG